MPQETLPDGIGRFADPARAFWHMASLISQNKPYSEGPLKRIRILQAAILRGDYFCLVRDNNVIAGVTWLNVVAERFQRTQPHYQSLDTDATDGIVLQSFAATDRLTAMKLRSHIEKTFAHKDIFWNRHKGKLGHRPKQRAENKTVEQPAAPNA